MFSVTKICSGAKTCAIAVALFFPGAAISGPADVPQLSGGSSSAYVRQLPPTARVSPPRAVRRAPARRVTRRAAPQRTTTIVKRDFILDFGANSSAFLLPNVRDGVRVVAGS